jgi:hypothetical protein
VGDTSPFYIIIQLTPHWGFSVTDYIKYYAYLCYLLSLDHYLYNNCDVTFLTVFILTLPVDFPCVRKLEHPEKTHDVRQSVDWLFSHESVARIKPTNSEVKGACSDECATEAPMPLGFMTSETICSV